MHSRSRPTPPTSTPSRRRGGPLSRRPRLGAPHQSLIRWNAMAMVVRANQRRRRHRRPYLHLRLARRRCARSASTTSSAASTAPARRRPHLLPGPRLPRHVRPRLPRRPPQRRPRSTTSAASSPSGGLSSLPAPLAHARLLAVPHGVDGPRRRSWPSTRRASTSYLENRGLTKDRPQGWAFLGDGETDEPEPSVPSPSAARERLDNLIFVINCNLQRLDGPVRGNGNIIQELEATFRGAGWNVIKVHLGRRLGSSSSRATTRAGSSSAWTSVVDGDFRPSSSSTARISASTSSAVTPSSYDRRGQDRRRAHPPAARRPRSVKIYNAYLRRPRPQRLPP